ncbi:hypothetical protein [Rothia halotolerans]|uniref:hypothetical protein n=1 Tax=Rothia halotolerans TaxID=405770 RepID=UPI00101BC21D|nr:hypothetical protein [Rothia halotolerans]
MRHQGLRIVATAAFSGIFTAWLLDLLRFGLDLRGTMVALSLLILTGGVALWSLLSDGTLRRDAEEPDEPS